MHQTLKSMVPMVAAALLASCTSATWQGAYTPLNSQWIFLRTDSSFTSADSSNIVAGRTPAAAVTVDLPHTPRLEPMVVNDQWQGVCYYAKHLTLNTDDLARHLFLKFEGAMNIADVYINGRLATHHLGGYLPFVVPLDGLVHSGDNSIVVRLDNADCPVTGPKPLHLLDFNTYGGLYRDVKLIAENDFFFTDANGGGTPHSGIVVKTQNIHADGSATIELTAEVANLSGDDDHVRITHNIVDADGKSVAHVETKLNIKNDSAAVSYEYIDIPNAKLWSPQEPNLYTVVTEIIKSGLVLDREETRIGIRTLKVTPEGLEINGRRTFLRGVNRHQEYPHIGYALSDAAQWRDAYKIKQAGFDYVRASHYPPSPAFLDACDELGIMVLDAILGWQYFGNKDFEAQAVNSSRELIRRDKNHPCVLAWELSVNETWMPQSFRDSIAAVRNTEQPGSYTAGWMKDGYDIYIEARQHRKGVDPTRPLIVSEYGDWEYYAQNAGFNQDGWGDLLAEERTSRQKREDGEKRMLQQALNVQEAHNDNLSTHAFADGYWVMFDYNRGYADDLEYSGIMDIYRLPKFAYWFFRSQRPPKGETMAEPMVCIASYCSPQSATDIRVYSNCDAVRLYANGREVAGGAPIDAISNNLTYKPLVFHVDAMPDSLRAVGYIDGAEACSHTVRRTGASTSLRLYTDAEALAPQAGCNDPIFVYADITDAKGTTVHGKRADITFTVEGDASFAGATEMTKSIKVPALGGTASTVLVIGRTAGQLKITATSEEKRAELLLHAH